MDVGNKVQDIMNGNQPWTVLFETYGKNCPLCGKPLLRPRIRDINGNKIPGACMTKGCKHKEELPNQKSMSAKQRDLQRKANYNDKIAYFKKYSVFNSFNTFVTKNFKSYKPVDQQTEKAKKVCMRMAHDIALDRTVHGMLVGSVGAGKTHLASAIFEQVESDTKWHSKVQFIDMAIAVEISTLAIRDDDAAKKIADVMAEIGKSDLVIIDDLGAERNTDWGKSFIDKIMRLREDKSIIITSNLKNDGNGEGFERYNDQTLSRMRKYMTGNSIAFTETKDYRRNVKYSAF